MEPNESTIIITGRILAEFEEDASQFLSGEPEFVSVPENAMVKPPSAPPVPQAKGAAQTEQR